MVGVIGSNDSRVAEYLEYHKRGDKLMEDVSKELQDLRRKYETMELDFASEKKCRQDYQSEVKGARQKLESLQTAVDDAGFTLVLIDADFDGYTFQVNFLLKGSAGGEGAAHALKTAIRENLKGFDSAIAKLPIVLRAFANVKGMESAMRRNGLTDQAQRLSEFVMGFSQSDALFDFVSLTGGSQRVDHKIRGTFEVSTAIRSFPN